MTILNVHVGQDLALVGVDSIGRVEATQEYMKVSKMFLLPHANAVLAGAGDLFLLYLVYGRLLFSGHRDFDELVDGMPAAIKEAWQTYVETLTARNQQFNDGQRLCLVGWSPRSASPICAMYEMNRLSEGFKSYHVHPGHYITQPVLPEERPFDDRESIAAAARAQLAHQRLVDPGFVCGGTFHIAEVTRDAVVVMRHHSDLEGPTVIRPDVH